jgi:hypothetical protein
MALGLLITFITGYVVSQNPTMLENVFSTFGYIIFVVVELALVVYLSARITKMQPTTAKICFLLYSFVSGLTFSSIFVIYEMMSIIYIFLIAAFIFIVMAVIGYTTKIDLTKISTYFIIGIIAILIVSLINVLFIKSSSLELIISIILIILFIGITAHDVQKIKRLENSGLPIENLSIYGALELYLDFINIFIELLSIFGNSKD